MNENEIQQARAFKAQFDVYKESGQLQYSTPEFRMLFGAVHLILSGIEKNADLIDEQDSSDQA